MLLLDRDGSLGHGAGVSVAPRHDFIVPGPQCDVTLGVACDPEVDVSLITDQAPVPWAERVPSLVDWNAYLIDPAVAYGQIIVGWCDAAQLCHHRNAPSISPTPWFQGIDDIGTVDGLEIRDLTDCALTGACADRLQAKHSPDGVHSQLGGNVALDRDYLVTLWADRAPVTPLVDVSALTAIEVMLRAAPAGHSTCISVPVAGPPADVVFSRGVLDGEYRVEVDNQIVAPAAPTLAGDWQYIPGIAGVVPAHVTACLDAAVDREQATMTILVALLP